jgi:hypothetical protein
MKAVATTILKLVQGSKVFLIPTFQRRYTWKKEQWSQLWEDLLSEYRIDHPADPDTLYGHFLGSVVLHPALGPASTLMRHQVIDGQQRLTTILVLLAALRDVRKAAEPTWNSSAIDDQYLTNPFSDEYPDRLIPTKLDREAYLKTVRQRVPTGDIGIAYNFFRTNIQREYDAGELNLEKLENTLLLHMLIVEINTKTGDSVNSIFNTLNSKGMELSAADLVRNEVLHHIGDDEGDEAHEKYWIPMEAALVNPKATSPDREFVTFLWAREVAINQKTSRDDLFPTFERRLRDKIQGLDVQQRQDASLSVLREMYEDHKLFLIVRDPGKGAADPRISAPLRASLQAIRDWRSEPVTPIVLWILKQATVGAIEQKDAAEALDVLLSYLVKRILHGIPTNQLNRLLTPVAAELASRNSGETVAARVRLTLSKQGYYWPTDDQVRATIVSNPIYASARRYVKFLLSVAETQLPGMEDADLSKSQIEHVMPQKLPMEWKAQLRSAGVELTDAEALSHTLGNLTLTDDNQKMSKATFEEKRAEYFETSALRLNQSLARLHSFLPDDIEARSLVLADLILRKFVHTPIASAASFSDEGSGASVNDRLESLLQSIPVGRWVTEEVLVAVLGASENEVRAIANSLDPTLARLIRDADKSIPLWFRDSLGAQVDLQDLAQPALGVAMNAVELSDLVAEAEGALDEASADENSDEQ